LTNSQIKLGSKGKIILDEATLFSLSPSILLLNQAIRNRVGSELGIKTLGKGKWSVEKLVWEIQQTRDVEKQKIQLCHSNYKNVSF